ncbi:hypothetical protein ACHQM5_020168 [Ranunculus cassubicifolius]
MPSKHNPPTVSSSSASSSDEGEDVEASHGEEEETPVKTSSKQFNLNSNPNPSSASKSDPSPSSGEEDDESSGEYESDSDVPTPNHNSAPLDVKPISSKPMPESLKKAAAKSSEASPVVALASVKRKPGNDEEDLRKDQKKKKVSDLVDDDETEKKSGDEKKLFQRFWTEEDEIVILKGMVDFKNKGNDPATQVNSFFDTIKGSLHTDVSKTQVQSKIRTIKRKYQNALKKVKPGAKPENMKPHEENVYNLCKEVWPKGFGKDEDGEGKSVETNVGGVDSKKTQSKKVSDGGAAASSPNLKVTALPSKAPSPVMVVKEANHQIKSSPEYAYLSGSTIVRNTSSALIPPPGLGDIVSKRGWDAIGSSKAKEFDDRWRNLIIAETKIYLQRIDLVREQTQAMLDMLESSN